jgi:PASTA domain
LLFYGLLGVLGELPKRSFQAAPVVRQRRGRLDAQVSRLFSVTQINVPDLKGKSQQEAEQTLTAIGLRLGSVTERPLQDPAAHGKILEQNPVAGTMIAAKGAVDILPNVVVRASMGSIFVKR